MEGNTSEFSKPTGEAAQEEVFKFVAETAQSGKTFRSVVDLDLTVVPYNRDPRACKIDPVCHEALVRISGHHAPIVITGRDGWRAQQLIDIPNAVVIGTYGLEARVGDQSYIDERIAPHADTITNGLSGFRNLFLQNMGIALDGEIDREFEIPIPEGGSIVVERKATGGIFLDKEGNPLPQTLQEGLAHVYNCNNVDPKGRVRIKEAMEKAYSDTLDAILQKGVPDGKLLEDYKRELQRLFSYVPQSRDPREPGDWGFDIGPKIGNSKAHVFLQLMRDPSDPKRARYLSRIPGGAAEALVYAGDSNPDAPAFHAGRLAGILTEGKRQAIGVWVMPPNPESQKNAIKQCSVAVNGIPENGQMLTKIADLLDDRKT